jgi:hypothetical protein
MPSPDFILAATADMPASLRGAALLGLVVFGGLLGVTVIVAMAWMRRRRAIRGSLTPPSDARVATDPWRESARRVRVDPEDGESWPPVDPRNPSA